MSQIENVKSAVRSAFADRKVDPLVNLMSDDVQLRPPTYAGEWQGKPLVSRLVEHAAFVLEAFHYTDEIVQGNTILMRFEATIEGRPMQGIDLIRVNDEGLVELIEIFSRPPKTALAMLDLMGQRIADDPGTSSMMQRSKG